ncbi:FAD-binding oxidoreductase [Albidovulum sediminicola]|uniref:FAD-binding oxidoreductase n=1 Tax=Albidovulum sediminicola TaxID=2984331 RepID=A0ABT2Z375_9RHOB|nr:FAD-binding oxidoreductase [Defluviimonas sp. WL0075]MCV2865598.1 FAD-binding oxidoreductase [Defluviimonas sp. WL0075]
MLNPADDAFAQALSAVLPEGTVTRAPDHYLEEPRRKAATPAALLARPRSIDEVARIVRTCTEARVGIVPWGGGTGLVQGQVKPEGPAPLILSLERMARVRALHAEENVIVVEAGATLAEVRTAAEAAGRLFPLSLASEGTARIGGNLSTNAGGVNVLRYGNARDLCLGLEAVLPDGSVLNGLTRLRKDNTGYALKDLLIGAEGTLGIITAAALKLFPRPAGVGTAFFTVTGPGAALALLARAQALTFGGVTSFELIHRQGLLFLDECLPDLRQPFADRPEWSVLAEIGLPEGPAPEDILATLFEASLSDGLVTDGVIAASLTQRQAFWTLRESLPEANRRIGAVSSHDISLPLSEIEGFVAEAPARIAAIADLRINCFGHLGDGNLHYNVFPPKGGEARAFRHLAPAVMDCVHAMVAARGGSISAEHGIGRLKVADLERYGDPTKLAAMRAIKAALDPLGIMNPGAVLRQAD